MGSAALVPRVLEGKLAVITGFPRGIGAGIARDLASKGASIHGIYTSSSSTKLAEDLAEELRSKHGVQIALTQADISQEAAAQQVATDFEAFANGRPLHILVNNAGVGGDYLLADVPVAEFHRIYNVNVLAPILVTQALLKFLPHDRSGRIINISSVASSMGFATHTLYGGTKAALEAMTRTWARELAERATVNAVNPGPVEGDMYFAAGQKFWDQMRPFQDICPLSAVRSGVDDEKLVKVANENMYGRRPAYFSEVAAVVGMLAGPDSAWTTGSIICANGGFKFQTDEKVHVKVLVNGVEITVAIIAPEPTIEQRIIALVNRATAINDETEKSTINSKILNLLRKVGKDGF
ncbi:hypothetical protein Sste5346_008840 [Sporothrix stenoceras]|uniref:Ketoreductase domain-containing protein n=1 Tax=Sporothrix stenoceras TaxID=5173 RepID=A0ABR3YMQ7_9PEZI